MCSLLPPSPSVPYPLFLYLLLADLGVALRGLGEGGPPHDDLVHRARLGRLHPLLVTCQHVFQLQRVQVVPAEGEEEREKEGEEGGREGSGALIITFVPQSMRGGGRQTSTTFWSNMKPPKIPSEAEPLPIPINALPPGCQSVDHPPWTSQHARTCWPGGPPRRARGR